MKKCWKVAKMTQLLLLLQNAPLFCCEKNHTGFVCFPRLALSSGHSLLQANWILITPTQTQIGEGSEEKMSRVIQYKRCFCLVGQKKSGSNSILFTDENRGRSGIIEILQMKVAPRTCRVWEKKKADRIGLDLKI